MLELRSLFRRLRGARIPLPPSQAAVSGRIDALYEEFWARREQPGWCQSPRGVWVRHQLDRYEAFAGWRYEQ